MKRRCYLPQYVLDTSAIMAVLKKEPGEDEVLSIIESARGHLVNVPFIALMEVEYNLLRRLPITKVVQSLGTIAGWPITIYESNPEWRSRAAYLKATGRLSLADAWIASLALLLGAELVHKDPEYDSIPGLKALRLPDSLAQEPA
jgi:predicted nucleic acid-binding protein